MVKAFRGKAPPTYAYVSQNIHGHAFQMQEIGSADDLQNLEDGQLHIHEVLGYSCNSIEPGILMSVLKVCCLF